MMLPTHVTKNMGRTRRGGRRPFIDPDADLGQPYGEKYGSKF